MAYLNKNATKNGKIDHLYSQIINDAKETMFYDNLRPIKELSNSGDHDFESGLVIFDSQHDAVQLLIKLARLIGFVSSPRHVERLAFTYIQKHLQSQEKIQESAKWFLNVHLVATMTEVEYQKEFVNFLQFTNLWERDGKMIRTFNDLTEASKCLPPILKKLPLVPIKTEGSSPAKMVKDLQTWYHKGVEQHLRGDRYTTLQPISFLVWEETKVAKEEYRIKVLRLQKQGVLSKLLVKGLQLTTCWKKESKDVRSFDDLLAGSTLIWELCEKASVFLKDTIEAEIGTPIQLCGIELHHGDLGQQIELLGKWTKVELVMSRLGNCQVRWLSSLLEKDTKSAKMEYEHQKKKAIEQAKEVQIVQALKSLKAGSEMFHGHDGKSIFSFLSIHESKVHLDQLVELCCLNSPEGVHPSFHLEKLSEWCGRVTSQYTSEGFFGHQDWLGKAEWKSSADLKKEIHEFTAKDTNENQRKAFQAHIDKREEDIRVAKKRKYESSFHKVKVEVAKALKVVKCIGTGDDHLFNDVSAQILEHRALYQPTLQDLRNNVLESENKGYKSEFVVLIYMSLCHLMDTLVGQFGLLVPSMEMLHPSIFSQFAQQTARSLALIPKVLQGANEPPLWVQDIQKFLPIHHHANIQLYLAIAHLSFQPPPNLTSETHKRSLDIALAAWFLTKPGPVFKFIIQTLQSQN